VGEESRKGFRGKSFIFRVRKRGGAPKIRRTSPSFGKLRPSSLHWGIGRRKIRLTKRKKLNFPEKGLTRKVHRSRRGERRQKVSYQKRPHLKVGVFQRKFEERGARDKKFDLASGDCSKRIGTVSKRSVEGKARRGKKNCPTGKLSHTTGGTKQEAEVGKLFLVETIGRISTRVLLVKGGRRGNLHL